jgi:tRNA pseudouridine55 synthase
MDGLLVVNKPAGPTSHDVVARVRRVLRERRIGHTGTLDPIATGVLPLVVGRATRLARFLTASEKTYEASIRFGFATDSGDATGRPIGERFEGAMPDREAFEQALDAFRGTFSQQPPAYSAKKIDGMRSYKLARDAARASQAAELIPPPGLTDLPAPPALPAPVDVTTHAIDVLGAAGDTITLRVCCSAGFYIRSLAHDLGERLGVGAHLVALSRTASGNLTLAQAVPLGMLERGTDGVETAHQALVPMSQMLPALRGCALTPEGLRRALRGQDLAPADLAGNMAGAAGDRHVISEYFRLVGPDGALVGIAEPSSKPGFLHPAVVLV